MEDFCHFAQATIAERIDHLTRANKLPESTDTLTGIYLDIIVVDLDGSYRPALERMQFCFVSVPNELYGFVALANGGPSAPIDLSLLEGIRQKAKGIEDFITGGELAEKIAELPQESIQNVTPFRDRLCLYIKNAPGGAWEAKVVKNFYGEPLMANRIAYGLGRIDENTFETVVTL